MGTQAEYAKLIDIGRPPNVSKRFPHSKALLVSGKVIDRALTAKGGAMTIAANGRNSFIIRGVLAAAQRATELDGKNPGGPFWDAVNRAKQAELRGIVASASELPTLEKRMNRVDVLQQCYFHGGVWRYWAAVIARTPTWLVRVQGRSIRDGEDAVRKSLACEPAFVGTYRFWAELRVKDGDTAGARVLLKKGLELPESNNPEVAAWNRHERMLCRRMLAAL